MFARLRGRFGRVDFDGEESRVKQTKPKSNDGHRTWSCGMWKACRQTSSPETVLNKVQGNEEEERLIRELELTTKERNELNDRLLYVTDVSMNKSPYFRPNPFYEKLKIKEKEVMSLLHNLEIKNTEHCQKFQELKKEINFYRHGLLLVLGSQKQCILPWIGRLLFVQQQQQQQQQPCMCLEMYSVKSLWVSGSWWSLWDLAVGMGERGFRILLCRVCFQQPAEPAPDGPGMHEEEVGHIEAGEQGGTAVLV
eukprot:XP_017456887.1 PREDICTED: uncharacterized protein LOC681364 isoform X1 [Rattus norvegicus]